MSLEKKYILYRLVLLKAVDLETRIRPGVQILGLGQGLTAFCF